MNVACRLSIASMARSRILLSPHLWRPFASSSSSTSNWIVNAIGSDRLGIVSDITKFVTDVGGNVGDSQAATLGSHFSLMMLVQLPDAKAVEDLRAKLENMEDMDADIYETREAETKGVVTPQAGYTGHFSLEGADHPGIVHQVASLLAKNGLNIEKMETSDEIAPHGGATLFKMRGVGIARRPLAAGFDPERIKRELEELGEDLNCDIAMEDAK